MHSIMDFPSEVLSQIFGSEYSSCLVIKIWLCGSSTLNKKLSNGLSRLDLSLHRFATCKFPRLVSEFGNLRQFAISSPDNLMNDPSHWTGAMKSLPKTLVSLSLSSPDCRHCLTDYEATDAMVSTKSSPGPPTSAEDLQPVLDLTPLFPCLQALSISADGSIPSHRFTKLPTSLTELSAYISLIYRSPDESLCRPLSQLPRGLLTLTRPPRFEIWNRGLSEDGVRLARADLLNVPPHLQTMILSGLPAPILRDFWLPQSLTKLIVPILPAFSLTPALARRMPPNLRTLKIGVDIDSFVEPHTNWVAHLPRTLTSVAPFPNDHSSDFTTFSHSLPPNLEKIRLFSYDDDENATPFGDWSCIETSEVENGKHWPKSLTVMKLDKFHIKLSDIARLPRTLLKLSVRVASPTNDAKTIEFDAKHFPPHLTDLTLRLSGSSKWEPLKLLYLPTSQKRRLSGDIGHAGDLEKDSSSNNSGDSLVTDVASMELTCFLKHLTSLNISTWHCDWFKLLPRGLKHFVVLAVPGLAESPLLASHDAFKDLPTTLRYLTLGESIRNETEPTPKIPPQRLDHLSSLAWLDISIVSTPSGIFKMLPQSLLSLDLIINDWDENDLFYIPPRLEWFSVAGFMYAPIAKIFQHVPLATLHRLSAVVPQIRKLPEFQVILQRIEHAVKHP